MYNVSVEYKEGNATQTLNAVAKECFAHVSIYGHHCNISLANISDHGVFEHMAAEHVEITKVSLTDADNNVVYVSEYWNVVDSVNHSFPSEGPARCDVNFARCDHSNHNGMPSAE